MMSSVDNSTEICIGNMKEAEKGGKWGWIIHDIYWMEKGKTFNYSERPGTLRIDCIISLVFERVTLHCRGTKIDKRGVHVLRLRRSIFIFTPCIEGIKQRRRNRTIQTKSWNPNPLFKLWTKCEIIHRWFLRTNRRPRNQQSFNSTFLYLTSF